MDDSTASDDLPGHVGGDRTDSCRRTIRASRLCSRFERLRSVEQECGFRYPHPFLAITCELAALARSPAYAAAFPHGQLVDMASPIQSAWAENLPDKWVPFMCEAQPKHTDYYCFDRTTSIDGPSVAVFADHAIVHEWHDFETFLAWIREQCRILKYARHDLIQPRSGGRK